MAYTDTDQTSDVMSGTDTPNGAAFLNKKRKRTPQFDPEVNFDPTKQIGSGGQVGAGADGTSNGSGQGPVSTGTKATNPGQVLEPNRELEDTIAKPPSMSDAEGGVSFKPLPTDPTNPTAPKLAKQGSSNPLLRFFQKATGFVKDSPEAGQPYTAPVTDEEKSQHAMKVAGLIGRGMAGLGSSIAAAGGGQPQQHEAMSFIEEQPKLAMQTAMARNEMQHRENLDEAAKARVGVAQENAETSKGRLGVQQQGQSTKDVLADANLREHGYVKQGDGSIRPMTAEEYARDPRAAQSVQAQQAIIALKQVETEHQRVLTELAADPNNPDRQLKKMQIEATLQAARERTNGLMALAGPRMQQANLSFGKEAEAIWKPAMDAGLQLQNMRQSYGDALKGNQQAMVNLVSNHVGMTIGSQPGARINQEQWMEAMQSAPWLQRVQARFDSQGYLTGVVLSPEQMRQMVTLGEQRYRLQVQKVQNQAQLMSQFMGEMPTPALPIDPNSPIPTEVQTGIGTQTQPGSIGGPAQYGIGAGLANETGTPAPAPTPIHAASKSKTESKPAPKKGYNPLP